MTTLEFGEVDRLVVLPEDFLGEAFSDPEEAMQRKLNWSRVRNQMKPYLLQFDDAFYSALTLVITPRDLSLLVEGRGFTFVPARAGCRTGTLSLTSDVVFFPGDGQHRVASIKEALKERPSLAGTSIPAVLVPYRGKTRVRQLFADLNLNAKPVNRTIGLSFETRDPVVVLTKRVIDDVQLFAGRVNRQSNSLLASSPEVITLNALYESNRQLLRAFPDLDNASLAELALLSPRDERVAIASVRLSEVWRVVFESLAAWRSVVVGRLLPGEARARFVFAHSLGWQAIARAAAVIIREDPTNWRATLPRALTSVNWDRNNPAWQGVAMFGQKINNTRSSIDATTGYILERAGMGSHNEHATPYLAALAEARSGQA